MSKLVCVVCGMEVNNRNFELNKNAFIDANIVEDIKFCPFCGASIEYLVGDGKEFSYDSSKLSSDTFKIIDHAVKLEIFNGDFYKKASVLAKDEKIKKMFEALSRIEYMHAKIHKKIAGIKEDPILRDMDYSKYDKDEVLLEMACKREKHAVEYYKKYSKDIEDENIKNIFKALAIVEEEHIELTDRQETA